MTRCNCASAGYSVFVDPAMKRAQLAERSELEQRVQLANMQQQMAVLLSPSQDPDVAARIELDRLKKQLGALADRLVAVEGSLVPPQRVPALLEDMIGRKAGLRLLSLKTLPVSPLLEKKSDAEQTGAAKAADKLAASSAAKTGEAPASPSAGLFKHGVEIRLEGSYQELAAYLERLEKSQSKLLWSSVSLSAEQHPRLVLVLTVYTLSLDRTWLIV